MKRYKKEFKESSDIYNLLYEDPEFKRHYIPIKQSLLKLIDYDIEIMRSICIHLLEEVNDHYMSNKLDQLCTKDMKF